MRAGTALVLCAGVTWNRSREVVVRGCVGASGGGGAAGKASPWPPGLQLPGGSMD